MNCQPGIVRFGLSSEPRDSELEFRTRKESTCTSRSPYRRAIFQDLLHTCLEHLYCDSHHSVIFRFMTSISKGCVYFWKHADCPKPGNLVSVMYRIQNGQLFLL
jgi:hypothetical protein